MIYKFVSSRWQYAKRLLLDMARSKMLTKNTTLITLPHKTVASALECIMVGATKCYSSSTKSLGIAANSIEVIKTWNSLQALLSQEQLQQPNMNADTISILRPDLVGQLMLPSVGLAVSMRYSFII